MGCAVLGLFAATSFVAYVGLGVWIIAPLPFSEWGPASNQEVRSRLSRVGGLRWFAVGACGAVCVLAGAVWGC
jgi:hypothetical protein